MQKVECPALDSRSSGRFLGVALVSLSTLVLELTLTRLFSATMYYHFAFLAISLALLGSGASGVFLYVLRPKFAESRTSLLLAASTALFAVTTVVALIVILSHPLSPGVRGRSLLLSLAWIYGSAALPFFFSGCAITLAITTWAQQISRLYLFDLVGAALGCLSLVPLLTLLGAIDTVILAAALALAGGWLMSRRAWLLPAAGAVLALTAWNHATGRIALHESKGLSEQDLLFSRWNSFSRVTVAKTQEPDKLLIFIDSDAATVLRQAGDDLERYRGLSDRIEGLAYQVSARPKVLVIGPGGGQDVILARLHGARDITAVEINPLIARGVMSREPFLTYSGRLYEQPGVRLVVDDGRSFLCRSPESYDLVVASLVDTWAATAAGAFALSENNLYTVEAFSEYLDRLTPGGVISMVRWYQSPPDELLRLVALGRVALTRRGIQNAAERFLIVRGPFEGMPLTTVNVLIKAAPFGDDEVARAEAYARRLGLELLYTPRTRPPGELTRLVTVAEPAVVWRRHASNISPTTDDSPFFFQTARFGNMVSRQWARGAWRRTNLGTLVLFVLFAFSVFVVVAFILGPLVLVRKRLAAAPRKGRIPFLLYFACLGAGFIVAEVVLIQKCVLFLGHPAYALTVVLFALLLASGIGSALSGHLPDAGLGRRLRVVLVAVAGLIALAVLGLSPLFYALVHLASPWRVLVTIAALAPLGLAMGMPMPTGIRLLRARAPDLIPWAWGVNGAASVLGSVGAVALAMMTGFNIALLAAAALYLTALGFIVLATRQPVRT
jgi:predicted membrane-bound spermidine synthase